MESKANNDDLRLISLPEKTGPLGSPLAGDVSQRLRDCSRSLHYHTASWFRMFFHAQENVDTPHFRALYKRLEPMARPELSRIGHFLHTIANNPSAAPMRSSIAELQHALKEDAPSFCAIALSHFISSFGPTLEPRGDATARNFLIEAARGAPRIFLDTCVFTCINALDHASLDMMLSAGFPKTTAPRGSGHSDLGHHSPLALLCGDHPLNEPVCMDERHIPLHERCAQVLLAHGADPDELSPIDSREDPDQGVPVMRDISLLSAASARGLNGLAKILIEAGARLDVYDDLGLIDTQVRANANLAPYLRARDEKQAIASSLASSPEAPAPAKPRI